MTTSTKPTGSAGMALAWMGCLIRGHEWDDGVQGVFSAPKTVRDAKGEFRGTLFRCRRCDAENFVWDPPPGAGEK